MFSPLHQKRISSPFFYLCLLGGVALYFVLSFVFAEKLQANSGLGWDGTRYADLATNLLQSKQLDSYIIMRIIPSAWVHIVFQFFGIEFSPSNIIRGFEFLNLLSILTGVFFTKKAMDFLKIQPLLQLLGLMLLVVNYGVLKFVVYYPVMTDAAGFALGAMVLYFYLKGETTNLWLATLLSMFCWPAAGFTGLWLMLFPYRQNGAAEEKAAASKQILPPALAAVYAVCVGCYLIYIKGDNTNMAFTLTVHHALAPLSIAALGLTVFWWASWLQRFPVFNVRFLKQHVSGLNLAAVVSLLVVFLLIKNFKPLPTPAYAQGFELIRAHVIFGIVRPFITLVSHVNYFGAVWILLILFHKSVVQHIGKLGVGFALGLVANLVLFGVKSESRILMNVLPWLVVLLVVSLNSFSFKAWMFLPAAVFNFVSSKLWLSIGDVSSTGTYADGTMTFPFQYFFMNLGPWMSEQMWLLFCVVFILSFAATAQFFFKIIIVNKQFVITKRFGIQNSNA